MKLTSRSKHSNYQQILGQNRNWHETWGSTHPHIHRRVTLSHVKSACDKSWAGKSRYDYCFLKLLQQKHRSRYTNECNQNFAWKCKENGFWQIRISQNPRWILEHEAGGTIGNRVGRRSIWRVGRRNKFDARIKCAMEGAESEHGDVGQKKITTLGQVVWYDGDLCDETSGETHFPAINVSF